MCSFVEVLLLLSIILVLVEFILTTGGISAFAGLVSFFMALALIFIMKLKIPPLFLEITIPAFIVLFILSIIVIILAYKAQKQKPIISDKPMLNKTGICTKTIKPNGYGQVEIDGEIWEATSDEEIKKGEKIKVIEQNSLKLTVRKGE